MFPMLESRLCDWGFNPLFSQALLVGLFLVLFVTAIVVVDRVAAHYLSKWIEQLLTRAHQAWGRSIEEHKVVSRLAHIAPVFVIQFSTPMFQTLGAPDVAIDYINRLTSVYVVLIITSVIFASLNTIQHIYQSFEISSKHPIKSYLQLTKIIVSVLAIILALAFLLGKSPIALLTGIGALTAVILVVFKDTLLGLMASIELAMHDIVRIGDWIEVPNFKADGDVIDMTLNTVKVQNFDKTISTIPTYALLTSAVKNWRGMYQSGGRRIKRSIPLDALDIKFLDQETLVQLKKQVPEITSLIDEHLAQTGDFKRVTNNDLFRAYAYRYLKQHPEIATQGFTLLVRELDPTENGLPIQLYCFTHNTDWGHYENVQAEIFDHLFAILPVFGLKAYQRSSDFKKEVNAP